jgi:hypothetical protein
MVHTRRGATTYRDSKAPLLPRARARRERDLARRAPSGDFRNDRASGGRGEKWGWPISKFKGGRKEKERHPLAGTRYIHDRSEWSVGSLREIVSAVSGE